MVAPISESNISNGFCNKDELMVMVIKFTDACIGNVSRDDDRPLELYKL